MIPRAVLFDAGNTLIHLDYPRIAVAVGAVVGRPLTAAELEAHAPGAAAAMERAAATDRERAAAFLEALCTAAGVEADTMETMRSRLVRLHRERHLWAALRPGTRAALERLRAAGVRLGIVSNSDGRVEEALEAAGLRPLFDVIVDSALVGVEKPDPRIFAVATEALKVTPAEAVYVGDLYEVDVVGARAAGLDVVLLAERCADPTVQRCATVPEVVDLILSRGAANGAPPHPVPSPRVS